MFINMKDTKQKVQQLKDEHKPIGCLSCGGWLDDGFHEYDKKHEYWFCPTLEENEEE